MMIFKHGRSFLLALLLFSTSTKSASAAFLFSRGIFPRISFAEGPFRGMFSFLRNGCTPVIWQGSSFFLKNLDFGVLARDDTIMQLSQTGTYMGADGINEYSTFLLDESPFIAESRYSNLAFRYVGFQDDKCVFNIGIRFDHITDDTTVKYAAQYGFAFMFKSFYNPTERYMERMNAFSAKPFLDFIFFQLADSDQTRNKLCEIYNGPCADLIEERQGNEDNDAFCASQLAGLPLAEGENRFIDGNSQGCRYLHASFAEDNPENHCAHISFAAQEDPKGELRCQESPQVPVTDLFDSSDFEFWNDYCERQGFDPELGHDEPECEYNGGTC